MHTLTPVAQEARKRATLEGERRFCGNKGEELTGKPVVMTKRDKLATLLDPRTANCLNLLGRTALLLEMRSVLLEAYVKFGLCVLEHRDPVPPASTSATAAPVVAADPSAVGPAPVTSAWSDDEDEDDTPVVGDPVAELKAKRKADLTAEFPSKFKNYRKAAESINWRELATKHGINDLPAEGQIEPLDLWKIPMGLVLKSMFFDTDPLGTSFGFLPKMAVASEGSIGSLLASSFPERIISVANQTVHKGNTLLSADEVDMLTVLRMNVKWINHMRKKHPLVLRTAIGADRLAESDSDDDD